MRTYKFCDGEYEVRNEIKRSVFITTIKGELDREEAELFVKSVKKKYADATHNCYAYVGDELGNITRFSDDGEPSGTAGQPILDVLRKQNLVKTAIVVTRYFGGIKLGAGGLVGAYSSGASDAVNACKISCKVECAHLSFECDYPDFSVIDKHLRKSECAVENVVYGDRVSLDVFVPTDGEEGLRKQLCELSSGRVRIANLNDNQYKSIR